MEYTKITVNVPDMDKTSDILWHWNINRDSYLVNQLVRWTELDWQLNEQDKIQCLQVYNVQKRYKIVTIQAYYAIRAEKDKIDKITQYCKQNNIPRDWFIYCICQRICKVGKQEFGTRMIGELI